jgi:integrase
LDKAQLRIINRPEAGELTKSRKNRTVPMHPTVKYELVKLRATAPTRIEKGKVIPKSAYVFVWESGEPLKPDWVTHQFARIAKIAGIAATIHDLRRSFSTLAQRAGVDRMTVKDLGGWSSVTVVEKHYTGEIQPALEKAMEKIAKSQGVA